MWRRKKSCHWLILKQRRGGSLLDATTWPHPRLNVRLMFEADDAQAAALDGYIAQHQST